MKNLPAIIGLWVFSTALCHSQGFINFGFEDATIVSDPAKGNPYVYASNAIPGWTPYISGVPITDIIYNTINLADPAITLQGPPASGGFAPIRGNYFILLQGHGTVGMPFTPILPALARPDKFPSTPFL